MNRRMRTPRPNLATIVGSGLAAVAAGSLLAFSSLAEHAGLQGLATGRIEPAPPARGGSSRAIRLPAPEPAPAAPTDPVEQLVRDAFARAPEPAPTPTAPVTPGAPADPSGRTKPQMGDKGRRTPERPSPAVAFAPRKTAGDGDGPAPAYEPADHKKPRKPKAGDAHQPHKTNKAKKAKKAKVPAAPVYARGKAGKADETGQHGTEWRPAKPKKAKKVAKGTAGGNGHGHVKHGHGNGRGRSKGKGHAKHGH